MAIVGLCLSLVAAAGCIAISVYFVKNCSLVDDPYSSSSSQTLECNGHLED
jgi:hypothetical protein